MKLMMAMCVAIFALLCATPTLANESAQALDKNGVAVRGYDPVAYFIEKRAVKGKPDFAVKIEDGAIYYFASAENRAIFIAEPQRYTPQYGGYCAMGAASGVKAQSDPRSFRVLEGKLYLVSNPPNASKWSQDAPNFIKKADANWASALPK
jgi:YHS domain-containing protein